MPGVALTNLSRHIDVEWLREALRRTRKDGAVGVDGQTWHDDERDLERNLEDLLSRFKTGRYFAPPVRRVHIPKGDGRETRPIGIPTLEDKVLQRAVAMCLSAVYERDFWDGSCGFRPGRSAHQARDRLRTAVMDRWGGWLVDVDVRRFFDTLDHAKLREILEQRARDGVILRQLGKWLNAGVLEGTSVSYPDQGTPQRAVISPLLANIHRHEVLDKWIEARVKPMCHGNVVLVRHADDFVILFRADADARAVYAALPKRFQQHGLTLHPEKTRLIPFRQWCEAELEIQFGLARLLLAHTPMWGARAANESGARRTAETADTDRFVMVPLEMRGLGTAAQVSDARSVSTRSQASSTPMSRLLTPRPSGFPAP